MSRRKAFTLVELLVVISIIALLLSILMPALQRARAMARQAVCGTRLHQQGIAVLAYSSENVGYLPMGWAPYTPGPPPIGKGPFDCSTPKVTAWPGTLSRYVGKDASVFICPAAFNSSSVRWVTMPAGKYSFYGNWNPPQYEVDMAYGMNWNLAFMGGIDAQGFNQPAKSLGIKNASDFCILGERALYDDRIPYQGGGSARPYLYGAGAQGIWLGPGPDDYPFSAWSTHFPASRHSKKANICFFDGHVAILQQLEAAKARYYGLDPANPLPGFGN
jgi:prepilin-type processing-associated H-X9-DG protein/prepilin-type N-terminal cleavage/methylation domain-containing protein